jgi:hypothetical protein
MLQLNIGLHFYRHKVTCLSQQHSLFSKLSGVHICELGIIIIVVIVVVIIIHVFGKHVHSIRTAASPHLSLVLDYE